jgi:glucose/arabinose dehydrogenase
MNKRTGLLIVGAVVLIAIIAAVSAFFFTSGDNAKLPETAAIGPSPTLPEPTKTPLPTVHIAPAKGWPEGAQPTAASGLAVHAFATGLSHPRLDR